MSLAQRSQFSFPWFYSFIGQRIFRGLFRAVRVRKLPFWLVVCFGGFFVALSTGKRFGVAPLLIDACRLVPRKVLLRSSHAPSCLDCSLKGRVEWQKEGLIVRLSMGPTLFVPARRGRM